MAVLSCKQAWPWFCFHHILSHCNYLGSELIQSFHESSRPLIKHAFLYSHMHEFCAHWLYFYSCFPGIGLNLILKIRLPLSVPTTTLLSLNEGEREVPDDLSLLNSHMAMVITV